MSERELEPTGEKDFGPCECCGRMSRSIWGALHEGDRTEAAYFVQWTLGALPDHGAYFDFIIGSWGDEASAAHRVAVSLEFRQTENGPEFMVIDSEGRPVSRSPLVHRGLSRAEVVGTPMASRIFSMVDFLWTQEGRIAEITGGPTMR